MDNRKPTTSSASLLGVNPVQHLLQLQIRFHSIEPLKSLRSRLIVFTANSLGDLVRFHLVRQTLGASLDVLQELLQSLVIGMNIVDSITQLPTDPLQLLCGNTGSDVLRIKHDFFS